MNEMERQTQRRTRIVLLIAALMAAVVTGGVVALVRTTADSDTASRAQPEAERSSGSAIPAAADPDDLTWVELSGVGMDLPVSRSAGPHTLADGRAMGFSHDPLGAAMAAIHLSGRASSTVGPKIYQPTIEEQVVGPYTTELRINSDADYNETRTQLGVAVGDPLPASASIAGYQLRYVSAGAADVSVMLRSSLGLTSVAVTVQWLDGDWKLVAPRDGDWKNAFERYPDASQFVLFGRG